MYVDARGIPVAHGNRHMLTIEQMARPQFSLMTMLLLSAAIPIWLFLIVALPESPGFGGSPSRFIMAPLVLGGITVAIHRLLRGHRNAWALSSLLAAVIALGSLNFAAWVAR